VFLWESRDLRPILIPTISFTIQAVCILRMGSMGKWEYQVPHWVGKQQLRESRSCVKLAMR
jgi:hypothetical protein